MRKMLMLLLPLFVGCIFPRTQDRWTVMTWNVQNLFDGIDDGSEYPEFDPGGGDWDSRLFQRRLDRVAEVIVKTVPNGADLIVLQELENQNVLDQLLSGPLKAKGYDYSLSVPGFSIIRCGIISRYPITQVSAVDCGEWGDRTLRPALSFFVAVPGESVRIIALHWKSPRGGRAATEGARRREAAIVRDMVSRQLQIDEDAKILILGDLNTPGDGLVLPPALGPYGGSISDAVLWRTDSPEFPPFDPAQIVLFDPEPAAGPPGTYNYRGEWDRPDRMLLSSGFTDGGGLVFQSSWIGSFDSMLDSRGYPKRWQSDLEEGYSDHLPLAAEFGREDGEE